MCADKKSKYPPVLLQKKAPTQCYSRKDRGITRWIKHCTSAADVCRLFCHPKQNNQQAVRPEETVSQGSRWGAGGGLEEPGVGLRNTTESLLRNPARVCLIRKQAPPKLFCGTLYFDSSQSFRRKLIKSAAKDLKKWLRKCCHHIHQEAEAQDFFITHLLITFWKNINYIDRNWADREDNNHPLPRRPSRKGQYYEEWWRNKEGNGGASLARWPAIVITQFIYIHVYIHANLFLYESVKTYFFVAKLHHNQQANERFLFSNKYFLKTCWEKLIM